MRSLLFVLFLQFSFLGLFGQISGNNAQSPELSERKPVCDISSEKIKTHVNSKRLEDGSIETNVNGAPYSRILWTDAGVFEPNTEYTIEFDAEVGGETPISELARKQSAIPSLKKSDEHLHIVMRPLSNPGHQQDLFRKNIPFEESPIHYYKRFVTPADISDYSLQIMGHGKIKSKISNLKIFKGRFTDFYPVSNGSPKSELKLENLPTGAPEFEIDLPSPAPNAEVVNAADFGLNETREDCLEILQKALDHCRKIGAAKLVIPKGKYKLYTDGNLKIYKMRDFTLDGGGSTFVYLRKKGCNLYVGSSERIEVRNLNMDWDWDKFPLAAIVRIESIHRDPAEWESYIDLRFTDYDTHPLYGQKDVPAIVMHPWNERKRTASDGNRPSLYLSGLYEGAKPPKSEWLAPNLLRVYISVKERITEMKEGLSFRLQHNYYAQSGIVLDSSRHITLRDFNVYSCAGHGLLIGGITQFTQLVNFNITPPDKSRCMSCSADHLHVASSMGYIKMIGCHFGLGGDDCVNIHDTTCFAVANGSHDILVNNFHPNRFKIGDVIEFRQGDFSPANYDGKVKSVEMLNVDEKTGKGLAKVTFTDPIPPQKFDGFVLFSKERATANVLIKDCKFEFKRGVLILCNNVTIEDCSFSNNVSGALKFETGYTFNIWCEGTGVNNAVVRNCKFRSANDSYRPEMGLVRDIWLGSYTGFDNDTERQTLYPIISNVLFENNVFQDSYGMVAIAASCGNVTFLNNVIKNTRKHDDPLPYRACFYLTHAQDVRFINNVWIESPLVPKAGFYIDWRNCKNIVLDGNRIELKE